jgi:hypothetical protein
MTSTIVLLAITFIADIMPANAAIIRILAMRESGVSPATVAALMDTIEDNLFASGLGFTIVIDLVDGGEPEVLNTNITGNDSFAQLISAYSIQQLASRRDHHLADLVFVFVDSIPGACGTASQHWQDQVLLGLHPPWPDDDGQNSDYIALISMASNCRTSPYKTNTPAHEFGHLLGVAHHLGATFDIPQFSTASRGDFAEPASQSNGKGRYTVTSDTTDVQQKCIDQNNATCNPWNRYSHTSTYSNPPLDFQYSARNTLLATASSVARYREVTCPLSTPFAVGGYILDICYGGYLETRHRVVWGDLCPQTTDSYELFRQQPVGYGAFSYFGTIYNPLLLQATVLVNGADSAIKVNACEGNSCTPMSISTYFAEYVECH